MNNQEFKVVIDGETYIESGEIDPATGFQL